MHHHSRRSFLGASAGGVVGGLFMTSSGAVASASEPSGSLAVRADGDRIRQFVGACHTQIDTVREMLRDDPDLAKTGWDWGFGDYESAIGACSHTGREDIIELLLTHGARPTIFTLATLDKHAAVRGFIDSMPGAREIEGPHSISLYRHAQAGNASRVMAFLEREGLDQGVEIFATDQAATERYLGVYGSEAFDQRIDIDWSARFGCLTLKIGDESARNLIPVGGAGGRVEELISVFRPAGSRGASVSFTDQDWLEVRYAGQTVRAKRIDG